MFTSVAMIVISIPGTVSLLTRKGGARRGIYIYIYIYIYRERER